MEKTGLFRQTVGVLRKNYISLLPVALAMEFLVLLPQFLNLALGRWGGLEGYLYQFLETGPTPPLWVAAGAGMLLGELRLFLLFCLRLGLLCLCLDKILGRGGVGSLAFCFHGKGRCFKCLGIYALFDLLPGILRGSIRALIVNGLSTEALSDYYVAMNYVNFGIFFLSRLFLSLLFLAVAYCFLSRPEAGVWRAVGRGLAEGVRRWPKCIGFWFCAVCVIQFALSIFSLLLTQTLGPNVAPWIMRSINVLLTPYFYLTAANLAAARLCLNADTEKEYDYGTDQN